MQSSSIMGITTRILLDEDVLDGVRKRAREESVPFRVKLNDLLRDGLAKCRFSSAGLGVGCLGRAGGTATRMTIVDASVRMYLHSVDWNSLARIPGVPPNHSLAGNHAAALGAS